MSIDVNKFRAGTPQVSGQGGFVATNETGGSQVSGQKAPTANGAVNVEALKATGKSVSSISGYTASNKLGGK